MLLVEKIALTNCHSEQVFRFPYDSLELSQSFRTQLKSNSIELLKASVGDPNLVTVELGLLSVL